MSGTFPRIWRMGWKQVSWTSETGVQDEISGSHFGEYEDDCLLGDRPGDGGSKHLWNVGKFLPDYTA
jgi:hypothetical protein